MLEPKSPGAAETTVREPGEGGDMMIEAPAWSSITRRVNFRPLAPNESPARHYAADPTRPQPVHTAAPSSDSVTQDGAEADALDVACDYDLCRDLASSDRLLDRFAESMAQTGVVGEDRNAKILCLALTSRLLPKPVNIAVKGPSSSGKSFLVGRVLLYFSQDAYLIRTTFSEHALIYTDEPFQHRHLVLAEASGAQGEKQEYLLRTLLSEGRIEHETVEKVGGVMTPRRITKEGPTGLIVTTTRAALHPENETRLLSLTVSDTREQTRAIMRAIADECPSTVEVDPRWKALQRWLAAGEVRVTVPFASALGDLASPAASRMRRDFSTLLSLVKSHALLHREHRKRDSEGRIIAELEDYAVVHDLVADLFAHGLAKTVKPTVRETVLAVQRLSADGPVTNQAIAQRLGLDEAASTRRCREAVMLGYIINREERKGRPADYSIATPMPHDEAVLPSAAELDTAISRAAAAVSLVQDLNRSIAHPAVTNGCAIDRLLEEMGIPVPSTPIPNLVEEVI